MVVTNTNTTLHGVQTAYETSNAARVMVLPPAIIIEVGDYLDDWTVMNQPATVSANTPTPITINSTVTFTEYTWYLDGILVPGSTSATFIFNQPPGIYELVVVVTNNHGEQRSGRIRITAVRL